VTELSVRKRSHLQLCAREDVEAHGGTLLDEVQLFHESLPELSFHEVDPSLELLGRRLQLPLIATGMTGGAPQAAALNRAIAEAAQKVGFGFGVGSQRAMLENPACADTYQVRDVAPDILLLANLGAVQAREAGPARAAELVDTIGADALCVHLNPAQELVQDEGDRDFRGCLAAIADLVATLRVPVVVKETGCGLAPATLHRLREVGVQWVDVSGSGGTTWTGVEALRGSGRQRALGRELREWGIPTAAAVGFAVREGLSTIASGGIRGAADVVRALVLGARVAGMALPFLRAYEAGGPRGVLEHAERLAEGIRALLVLTGARDLAALREVPRVLGPALQRWARNPAGAGPWPSR